MSRLGSLLFLLLLVPRATALAEPARPPSRSLRLDRRWFPVRQGLIAVPHGCSVPSSADESRRFTRQLAALFTATVRTDARVAASAGWRAALRLLDQIAAGTRVSLGAVSNREDVSDEKEQAPEFWTEVVGRVDGQEFKIACMRACCGWESSCSLSAVLPGDVDLDGQVDDQGTVGVDVHHCGDRGACPEVAPSVVCRMRPSGRCAPQMEEDDSFLRAQPQ
jgi:hypothetical protein